MVNQKFVTEYRGGGESSSFYHQSWPRTSCVYVLCQCDNIVSNKYKQKKIASEEGIEVKPNKKFFVVAVAVCVFSLYFSSNYKLIK